MIFISSVHIIIVSLIRDAAIGVINFAWKIMPCVIIT